MGDAIITRVPWTVQPQFPAPIDWNHPLAKGLISVWTPTTGLILRGGGASPANAGTAVISPQGAVGRLFNGTSDNISLGGTALAHGTGSRFALVRTGAVNAARTISAGGATSTGFRLNSTAVEIVSVGASVSLAATLAVLANSYYSLGISYAASDLEIYRDGGSIASSAASTGSTDNNADFLGQNGSGAQYFDGSIFLHLSYDIRLPSSIQKELNRNPWQLFRQLTRRIWAPSTAAGGFKAYWANRNTRTIGMGRI